MSDYFYNLGRRLGRAAIPAAQKGRWIWSELTGSPEEALMAERGLGTALAVEMRAAHASSGDSQVSAFTNDLCQRLAARVKDHRRTFHCDVVEDEFPNAVALPGGFIFLSSALVGLTRQDPDELAFVIGHEMAHVIRGHAWDRMLNQTALKAAGLVAARAGPLGSWLRGNGLQLLRSAHSQTSELEADELGLRLMAAAGFATAASIQLLQRLEQLGSDPTVLGQYLSSHPPATERIARLKPLLHQVAPAHPASDDAS